MFVAVNSSGSNVFLMMILLSDASLLIKVESEIEPDHVHTRIGTAETAVRRVLDAQRQRYGFVSTESRAEGGRRGEMQIAAHVTAIE